MTRDEVISWLEQRTRIDEETGCLLWTGCINSGGHPIATVDGGRGRVVRRWLFDQLTDGRKLGNRVLTPGKCNDLRCLNSAHWLIMTSSQMNRHIAARGGYTTPARRAACIRNGRKRGPYSDEQINRCRQLRAEGKTLRAISDELGVHLSTVSRTCRGERHLLLPGASVFGVRPAQEPRRLEDAEAAE